MFNSYVKLPEGIVHDYHYSFIAEPLLPVPDDAVVQRHLGRQGLFQRHNTPSPVAGCGNLWLFPFGNGIHGGVCESISLSVYCVYIYVCVCVCYINYTVQYLLVDWRAIGWMVRCQAIRKAISLLKSPFHRGPGWWWWWFSIDKLRRYLSGGLLYKKKVSYHHFWGCMPNLLVIVFDLGLTLISLTWQWQQKHPQLIDDLITN